MKKVIKNTGDLFFNLHQIANHSMAGDKQKELDIKKVTTAYDTSSLEVTSMVKKDVMGVPSIKLNDDEDLIFPLTETFDREPVNSEDAKSTYIGDEETAVKTCLYLNKNNQKILQEHLRFVQSSLTNFQTIIDRQERILKDINAPEEGTSF